MCPTGKTNNNISIMNNNNNNKIINKKPNIVIVGGGRMGMIRASNLMASTECNLYGIVETWETKIEELKELYACPIFASLDEVLQDENVTAIWLSTPTFMHVEQITACAVAGKPVGCEKPVANTIDEIQQCYDICAEKQVTLFCSFQRRTDLSYQRMKTAVSEENAIGQVKSIHAVFRDHPVPPIEFLIKGGDIFHDLIVHDADFIMNAIGEVPHKVYAQGSSFHPALKEVSVIDHAHAMLEFPSGAVACCELSRCSGYGYDQRIEMNGELGMVQVDNMPKTTFVKATVAGTTRDNPMHSFPQRFSEAYGIEINNFINVVKGNEICDVTAQDCINSTLVAIACNMSVEKKLPVYINVKDNTVTLEAKAWA